MMQELEAAHSLEEQNEYEQALNLYQHVLQQIPGSREAWEGTVRILCTLFRGKEAIEMANVYISHHPDDMLGWLWKGKGYLNDGGFDEALVAFEEGIRKDPHYAPAWVGKGNALFSLDQFDQSKACYEEALKWGENNADAWNGIGNCDENLDLLETSKNAYECALQCDNRHEWAWIGLAEIYKRMKKNNQARNVYFHMIEKQISSGKAQALLGEMAQDEGRIEEAKRYIEEALAKERFGYFVYQKAAELYYLAYEDYEKAIEYYIKALDTSHRDWYLFCLGECYNKLGNEEEAKWYYRRAIARHAHTEAAAASWVSLGEIEESDQHDESALDAYRQARQAYPQYEQGWRHWMVYVANHGGTHEELLEIIEQGLAACYHSARLWIDRASIYDEMGNIDLAQKSLEMAKEYGGEDASDYWGVSAQIKLAEGRRAEAIPILEEAIRRNQDNVYYIHDLSHLYAQERNLEQAQKLNDEFVTLEPENSAGWELREWIYRELGNEREAKRAAREMKALQKKRQV